MSTSKSRSERGNVLKALFNKLWDCALMPSPPDGKLQGEISYRDMTRIADALRHQGPQTLEEKDFPNEIEAGLRLAIAVTHPTSQRVVDALKFILSSLTGATGITIAIIALTNILHPGVWAVIVTFFAGSHVAGPVAAIGGGLAMVSGAVFLAYQKFTPTERAVWAHQYVTRCIDVWISRDDKKDKLREQANALLKTIETQKLSGKELSADEHFIAMLNIENSLRDHRIMKLKEEIQARTSELMTKLAELTSGD